MKIDNIRAKIIATLEQRNDENLNICCECGCIIEGRIYESEDELFCEDCADVHLYECEDCGELFRRDNMTETVDGTVCERCLDSDYAYCDQCEQFVRQYEINMVPNGQTVCDACLENGNGFIRCERCGDIIPSDDYREVYINDSETESWCDCCGDYHSNWCECCDRYFSEETVEVDCCRCEYCEEEEHNTPQHCGNIDNWEAPHGIMGYSYKPDPCFCMTEEQKKNCELAQLIHFGFELEMEYRGRRDWNGYEDADYLNNTLGFTYCKRDGSLSEHSLELVSHPATFEYLMEKKAVFEEVFSRMIRKGYTSHKNGDCGLHVHISHKPMVEANPYAVNNLYILVNHVFWDKLVRFSRRTESQLNHWARRYCEAHGDPKEIVNKAKRSCGRYMAVNLENTHTVELRMFRGTLKLDTFIATIQLIKRLVDLSLSIKEPQDAYNAKWEQLIDCDYEELRAYCAKRFAEEENDESNDEVSDEPGVGVDFSMSEAEMHRNNLRVGDEIEYVAAPDIVEAFIGATGVIESIADTYCDVRLTCDIAYEDGLFGGITMPRDAVVRTTRDYTNHIRRTTPLRAGDYVRLRMNNRDFNEECVRQDRCTIGFSNGLEAGRIGIIRAFSSNGIYGENAAVEFDAYFTGGHDCAGNVENDSGQWIDSRNLELI